ncbi:DNA-binding protein [Stackebrandtia soli]|uniref:DNA-binding protein n=1 Tax=Stackebrandtia soli TaxID=1892856 RepID=UPI0039E94692
MPRQQSRAARFLEGLTATEEELYAASVRDESEVAACSRPVRGERVHIVGRLTTVVMSPASGLPTVQAELFNGDFTVTLLWIGRGRIVGIEPGRKLIARGRVATGESDRIVMYNPWYELIGNPDDE